MEQIYDGNFYECRIAEAKEGMRYKIRIYEKSGSFLDHCDPYGYGMELRPQNASIIRDLDKYIFQDSRWLRKRTVGFDKPVNIYEVHLGSWRTNPQDKNGWYTYSKVADMLIPYVKENGYNYIEIMPLYINGVRMDAVSNMIYWQGNSDRGVNKGAVNFLQCMNTGIKEKYPDVMLIAEDSTPYPNVTRSVEENGLGFDYKWDMGWMNDILNILRKIHLTVSEITTS